MKKVYVPPAEIVTCDAVSETMAHGPGTVEFNQLKKPIDGSVGFHV
jgi:hypothetical protein